MLESVTAVCLHHVIMLPISQLLKLLIKVLQPVPDFTNFLHVHNMKSHSQACLNRPGDEAMIIHSYVSQ